MSSKTRGFMPTAISQLAIFTLGLSHQERGRHKCAASMYTISVSRVCRNNISFSRASSKKAVKAYSWRGCKSKLNNVMHCDSSGGAQLRAPER